MGEHVNGGSREWRLALRAAIDVAAGALGNLHRVSMFVWNFHSTNIR
jgi:hypothetical protein